MARSKYINTFDTTAEYDTYIESAIPEFPNVGYDKEADVVNIRRQSPNNYQIWGTTTATSNFNTTLNGSSIEFTVDPELGEFYLQGWTGTLTTLDSFLSYKTNVTSLKKFALDTSQVTNLNGMFMASSSLKVIHLEECDFSNVSSITNLFRSIYPTDVYITVEATLMKLTNNLTSQGNNKYIPSSATIHYNDVDYKWQNNAWTPQS